ncbi:hypothetical protein QTO34_005653 [Cnephaeus nilssonii]|uniref:DDE-1 domain-containing protein n=1 Tax=Cnephaeus nilssonii TaxID=3371016 RepID=A0AA40HNS1_CNENI|nr:hypothetical protein QTO34_005653 [Eptesicus nilssonii]
MKVATLSNRVSVQMTQLYIGRRCHLGLPYIEKRNVLLQSLNEILFSGYHKKPLPQAAGGDEGPLPLITPVLYKRNDKVWITAHLLTTWSIEYVKPTLVLLTDNAPGHPRAQIEMYNEIILCSCLLTQHPFCSPWIRENTFYKAIAAINSDFSDESGQVKLSIFWKGFTILDAIKNIYDSWEEVKLLLLRRIWKKLVSTLTDDFERFKTHLEEVTADVVDIARALELEVNPADVTEWL